MALYMTDSDSASQALQLKAAGQEEEVTEVWVTIEAVSAKVDGKWVTLFEVPKGAGKVNLMDLHFRQQLVGNGSIPAGKYSEIRFELSDSNQDNYLVLQGGTKVALKVPSNELKPEINISIAKDTFVELVFDVNQSFLVERGSNATYNLNPRKALRFVGSFDDLYGSLQGELVLPEGLDKLLSIQMELYRSGYPTPIWNTSLQENKLKFEITTLPPGQYWLEAKISLLGRAELELRSDPFTIEVGQQREVFVR